MNTPLDHEQMVETLGERLSIVLENVEKNEKARTADNGRFLAEMQNLLDLAGEAEIPRAFWEDHELAWVAYCSRSRSAVVAATANIMLAIEAMERKEPEKVTPEVAQKLYWWRNEGGREQFLGELPIEERRALEVSASRE